jgi:hypothetical protein
MPKLEVSVELKDLGQQPWPELHVYVFNRAGRLVATHPLRHDPRQPAGGRVEIDVPMVDEPVTLKIGPPVDDPAALEKLSPATKTLRLAAGPAVKVPFEIPAAGWRCWIRVPYLVTGTVTKLESGKQAPICAGEVDVFDVDVGCFLRMPDPLIERVRLSIIDLVIDPPEPKLQEIVWWNRWEDEYCGTPPKVPPRPMADDQIVKKLEALPREWAVAKARFAAAPGARTRVTRLMSRMPEADRRAWLDRDGLPGVKINDLLYSSTAQFRELVVAKFQAFRFWLCWYPWVYWLWWPWCWYGLEKLGTATLNHDGTFSLTVLLSICRGDTPDLWFVVRQEIGGVERVIYARHPVPCNTYWDHPSGKHVSLIVTDPLAVACHQEVPVNKPGPYVLPLGIRADEWHQIHQAHIKPPAAPHANRGLYGGTDPYGTGLHFTMQFHDGLRGLGVWYYRWSYRKEGPGDWTPINTAIVHRYLTLNALLKPVIETETLGPKTVGSESNLFLVRDPAKDWIATDNTYAVWNTALWNGSTGRYEAEVPDGKYELRLEMFDNAGNKVTPAGKGFKYFLLTGAGAGDVDDALSVEPDGSLILHLHVDNQYTVADIQQVALNGAAAGECTFLQYTTKATDTVGITYLAYHPNGFLDHYDLNVLRGISGSNQGSKSSTVPAPTPATASFFVQNLLDAYSQCAFAAHLHTWPRTRDGYSRIRAYESHDTSAFALIGP